MILGFCTRATLMVFCMLLWSVTQAGVGPQKPVAPVSPEAVEALHQFSTHVHSMSAQFEQTSADLQGYVIDRLEGVFYFKRPTLFRFAYTAPSEELIVSDGEKLWHYDPSLAQATVRPQSSLGESPVLLLTDWAKLSEAYRVVAGEDPGLIKLFPNSDQMGLVWVEIEMEGIDPSVIRWLDEFGQETQLKLTELVVNPSLDSGLFTFSPPSGVDVLEGF